MPRNYEYELVELNVGGQIFTCCKSTLTKSSRYFREYFAADWKRGKKSKINEDGPIKVFVDQNPEPFWVLLEYMRTGCIECDDLSSSSTSRLAKLILLQAEYFGMDQLLCAIKYRTYLNKHPEFQANSVQDVIFAFDNKYGSIKHSITHGILPKYLKKREERKEYAILGKSSGKYLVVGPKRLFVGRDMSFAHNPHRFSMESGIVPVAPTFLDCLNWLGMHGFTNIDRPECLVQEGIRRYVIFYMRAFILCDNASNVQIYMIENFSRDL